MDVKIERCRSCGAPIIWQRTASGKLTPVNVAPDGTLGETHWATCPQAQEWKQKRDRPIYPPSVNSS